MDLMKKQTLVLFVLAPLSAFLIVQDGFTMWLMNFLTDFMLHLIVTHILGALSVLADEKYPQI